MIGNLFGDPLTFLTDMLYRVPAILFALILHEWAHAYVAFRLGDPTAKMMGRLTLNPLRHLDPLGTAFMLILGFGWARPVPINPNYFKKLRRDDLLVSIAGIAMNLLLYAVFITGYYALAYYVFGYPLDPWQRVLSRVISTCAMVNISLAVFNLIPIPPLDGSHVLNDLVFRGNLFASQRTAQIGMSLLLLASFTGVLGEGMSFVIGGVLDGTFWVLERVFGV